MTELDLTVLLFAVLSAYFVQWVIVDAEIVAEPREWVMGRLESRYGALWARKALVGLSCGPCLVFWYAVLMLAVPLWLVWVTAVPGGLIVLKKCLIRLGVNV